MKQLYTTCRPAERLPPLATGTMPSWATPSCIALAVRQLLRENRRRFTASNLHIVELTARDAKQTLSHALRDAWRGHTWSQFLKSDAKAAEAFRHCNSAQVRQRAHNMMLRWARGGEDRRHLPAITSGHYVSKTRLLFTQRETGHPFPLRLRYAWRALKSLLCGELRPTCEATGGASWQTQGQAPPSSHGHCPAGHACGRPPRRAW